MCICKEMTDQINDCQNVLPLKSNFRQGQQLIELIMCQIIATIGGKLEF